MCFYRAQAQSDTIYSDNNGTYRLINQAIVFDNGADTHAKINGVMEVGEYYGHVIPYKDTNGYIQMLSTHTLRPLNSIINNPLEGYYELSSLDWIRGNGSKYLMGVNPCHENLHIDTLGQISRVLSDYNTYIGSCFHLLDSAKSQFYNCNYQKAKSTFSKIDACNSPNYQFVNLFLSFTDTLDCLSVLRVKKTGRYTINCTIQTPSYNHGLWFINQYLAIGFHYGDSLNNPNYSPDEYKDDYNTLKYTRLSNGDYKIKMNYKPKKSKRKIRGENGEMNKTRSYSSTVYFKREGRERRDASFLFLSHYKPFATKPKLH